MDKLTFNDMRAWDLKQLRQLRKQLRDTLSDEINKRQAIKAEIMFLQREIEKYKEE